MSGTIFEICFAAAVVVAAAAVAGVLAGFVGRRLLAIAAGAVGVVAVAAWIAFALDPDSSLAVAAAGLSGCVVTILAAAALEIALARARDADRRIAEAERQVDEHVAAVLREREAEMERTLSRARSDSLSLLVEHERQVAEERRRAAAEQESAAAERLSEELGEVQRRVELRLGAWTQDLERAQQGIETRLASLAARHEHEIAELETRLGQELERISSESDQQRVTLARVRTELEEAADAAVAAATAELEAHAGERRRALRELSERLQRREHELAARVEAEESEALRRVQSSFADVERRQVEQLARVVERASERFLELATQQFDAGARTAREDAGQRLARELDRAVQAFSRDAQSSLAEELARISGAGAQRLERRLSDLTSGLDRRRDAFIADIEQRLAQTEQEYRQRLRSIAKDAEAARTVIEERLQTLSRRVDEAEAAARR